MWDWGVILAVCSRNVEIYITRDYIVRQTKNLALLLFTTKNNHNLVYEIFTYIVTLFKKNVAADTSEANFQRQL